MKFLFSLTAAIGLALALMPLPRSMTAKDSRKWVLDDLFTVEFDGDTDQVLLQAVLRMQKAIYGTQWYPMAGFPPAEPEDHTNLSSISAIRFNVKNTEEPLQFGIDEHYLMETRDSEVVILAPNTWGALHAVHTLQQLVFYNDDRYYLNNTVAINDQPYFPHRGVMLDTARNFLSIQTIKEQIEVMALVKLNVLHWHIVDSQLWPIQVFKYPNMTLDAYLRQEMYTQAEIKELVEFARVRGVRIIPEIDMPSHARAGWRKADSLIVACGDTFWNGSPDQDVTAVEPPPGQLDPLSNKTYEVVLNVYKEIGLIFKDNWFHVGADEISLGCYNQLEPIQKWLKDGNRTYGDLLQHWADTAMPIFHNRLNETRLMMWADAINGHTHVKELDKSVVLQAWGTANDEVPDLIAKGYDVVVLNLDFLYLDCGNGGWVSNDPRYVNRWENRELIEGNGGSWCGPYKSWQMIYDFSIIGNLTKEESKHVLGAEAAMWAEQSDDLVMLIKLWPRLAALAENLWSGNRDKDGYLRTNEVTPRILNFREYVQKALGVRTHPLMPRWCYRDPTQCNLNFNQTELKMYGRATYY